jgi:hypothetical protein
MLLLALLVVVHGVAAIPFITEHVTVTRTATDVIPANTNTFPINETAISTAIDIPVTPTPTLAFALANEVSDADSSDTSTGYTVMVTVTLTPTPTTADSDASPSPTDYYIWLSPATYSLFSYDLFIVLGFALCWALGGFSWWAGEQRQRARWADDEQEVDWDELDRLFGVRREVDEEGRRLEGELRRLGMM